jgi:hypothetical protein
MPNAYVNILRSYWGPRYMWRFLIVLLPWSINVATFWGQPTARVSLMSLPLFVTLMIGTHLFQQSVHAHLSRLPGAGRANLLVGTALVGSLCLALPTLVAWLRGASAWGVLGVLLAGDGLVLAAIVANRALAGFAAMMTVMYFLFPIGAKHLLPVVNGDAPEAATWLALGGLAALGYAANRLAHLADWNATFVFNKKAGLWTARRGEAALSRGAMSWVISNRWVERNSGLERLRGTVPTGLLARVRLWQLGLGLDRLWIAAIIMTAFFIGGNVFFGVLTFSGGAAGDSHSFAQLPAMLAMTSTVVPGMAGVLFWHRRHCLELESLRPTNRRRFILEIGLAAAFGWLKVWLATLVMLGLAVAVLRPSLLAPGMVVGFVVCHFCFQAIFFGIVVWVCAARTFWAMAAWAVGGYVLLNAIALLAIIPLVAHPSGGGKLASATIPITILVLATAIVAPALIVTAYRRWCNLELGAKT